MAWRAGIKKRVKKFMSIAAIIPARGGSKRIPRKNITPICGKPIIAYSIEAAIESKLFDEVMTSTDDFEIAKISKFYGAKAPFMRSPENSSDTATTAEALLEVIYEYEKLGMYFDEICCIYPTALFVTPDKLKDAYKLLEKGDSVMAVAKYSYPVQRSLVIRNGFSYMRYPEYINARSQDLEAVYHDCGQFYYVRTVALKDSGTILTPRTVPYITPESEVQDIDTMEDLKLAEIKYKYRKY
jgi:N-acylneuraminate cytidylyltransferase